MPEGTPKAPTGGSNRCVVWALASPYTAPTAISGITDGYMLFDKSETSTITGDVRTGAWTLELANKIRNANWLLFKNAFAVNATITTTTVTYEDGTEDKITTVPSSAVGKRLVAIHLDGALAGEDTITTIATCLLDGASLGSGRAANTLGDTPFKIVSVPAPTQLVVPVTAFAPISDLITAAVVTIPATCHGTELLM